MDTPYRRQITFSLSPAEFLAFVWVYRNEIKPFFDKCEKMEPSMPQDMKIYYQEIRSGILNGNLIKCQLLPGEAKFFQRQSEDIFALFRNSQDKVRKPEDFLVKYARNILTDLIIESEKGKLIGLESSLVNGNITFSIKPDSETILDKRPY